ncbi:hypothetical protein OTU49_005561 [Cherax quadricarinatus]|uniref:C-type lectin domain-containing protein n=1 Tax=Cherax quadricarinatus TaxID=27406 RepID=A0AAW0X652_CHEQU
MVPARVTKLLVLSSLLIAGVEGSRCSSGQVECKTGGRCININYVCSSGNQCSDGSDEDPSICKFWKHTQQYCSSGNVYCNSGCYSFENACNRMSECPVDSRICQIIKQRKLALPPKSMNMTSELVTLFATAVNSTLQNKKRNCPLLYTYVGDRCLSLFSAAKVSWPEARQFCRSIYGDLLKLDDLADLGHLLQYMRASMLTSDYWIGGRFDLDTNAWSWTVDDSTMPLGSPFWAERHISTCTPRPPPHTDPFSDPPAALPGATCYEYTQAPENRQEGWCSALTYKHFYYISDESCQEAKSPLCMLEVDMEENKPEGEPTVSP